MSDQIKSLLLSIFRIFIGATVSTVILLFSLALYFILKFSPVEAFCGGIFLVVACFVGYTVAISITSPIRKRIK